MTIGWQLASRARREADLLSRLAAPLVAAQLLQVGMAVTDTVMAGRLGPLELGAVALGSALWLPIFLASTGVMLAISPLVARLRGARRLGEVGALYQQGLWLALLTTILVTPGTSAAGALMSWIGVDPKVEPVAQRYLDAIAWGMPGACLYLAGRFVTEGLGLTRPVMYIQCVALLANATGNYVLMYGKLGFPALGAVGAGWSSAVVLCLDACLIHAWLGLAPAYRDCRLWRRLQLPRPARQWQLLQLGVPIAGSIVAESGLFAAASLLMGSLGTLAVASHQVAVNYAALAFMVPLGLSLAITVRVGNAIGAGRLRRASFSAHVGLGMGIATMACSALILLAFREQIVSFYTRDPEVAVLAAQLLLVGALFQMSDGLQVSAAGALRGLGDTAWPMLITACAYWLIGLPLAYLLGVKTALGPVGIWFGLTAGLTASAVLLTLRLRRVFARSPGFLRSYQKYL
jgi:MATE family multidrug resistance protein